MGNCKKLNFAVRFVGNSIKNIIGRQRLVYVTEGGWVIEQEGRQIVDTLNRQKLINSRFSVSDLFLRNKIVHYGSINTFLDENGIKDKNIKKKNKVVVTWFHIPDDDNRAKYIPLLNEGADVVHTSCNLTKKKLINHGLDKEKIVVVPLGVDLSVFHPETPARKREIRKRLNLPDDRVIIGSFQKDGTGWGDGLEPKLVKGPDIFLQVIKKLAKQYPIFVLLTGPARGYVKKGLKKLGVPYLHHYLDDYLQIVDYYNALDLYLVTSREEGGPKAILESMACGIPLVTTRVGMAPDIIKSKINGMIAEVDDIEKIISNSKLLLENYLVKENTIKNGLESIKNYGYTLIADRYYKEIYSKLL